MSFGSKKLFKIWFSKQNLTLTTIPSSEKFRKFTGNYYNTKYELKPYYFPIEADRVSDFSSLLGGFDFNWLEKNIQNMISELKYHTEFNGGVRKN